MAGSDTVTDSSRKATAARVQSKDEAQWPLTYKMQTAKKVSTLQAFGVRTDQSVVAKKPWWSHTLYRGPADKPVEILYSKTKEQSEALAQLFVSESIIGFDMVIIALVGLEIPLTLHSCVLGVALFQREKSKTTRQDRTDTNCNTREGCLIPYRLASREDDSRHYRTDITQDHRKPSDWESRRRYPECRLYTSQQIFWP
jgi:hypothetical protein